MIEITYLSNTNSSLGFFSSIFLLILLCSSIRLTQLIQLQRRFFGSRYIRDVFFLGPKYIGDDFFFRADLSLGAKQEGLTIVWYSWPLGFFCLISGSGNGWIHVFNGDRHSVQIFPSQQSTKSEGSRVPDYIQSSCRSFIGVIVPYEISKVNFHVETKILVSMSEEI